MTPCPTCGAHRGKVYRRGPLMVQTDPPAAYWRGLRLAIEGRRLAALELLVRLGEATEGGLQMVASGEHAAPQTMRVVIGQLRRLLLGLSAGGG